MMDLLIRNIGQLATPTGTSARKGKDQGNITIINNAAVGIKDGKIAYVGKDTPDLTAETSINADGKLVTPGLVDSHTHLVFGGWRNGEFAMKLANVPYLDILRQGGGILSTVNSTRNSTEEELFAKSRELLKEMLIHGTTTVEAKSGYGLDLETELKQLRVAKKLNEQEVSDVVSTFMGAHAVPKEYENDRAGYIDYLCKVMLPEIKKQNLAEFCDIFCETAVFTPEESRHILGEAGKLGYQLKAHVDEIDYIAGAEMAAEMGCLSAEHLIMASDDGIKALAKSGTIAVTLPATSFYIDKTYARSRKMVEEGVAVAVATDFNPGSSPNLNLQFAMSVSCLKARLTPEEALTAVTLNGAAAINRADTIGSIEVGKKADILLWNAPELNYIVYRYGSNMVSRVIKDGKIID